MPMKPWSDPKPISDAPKDRPILAWCENGCGWAKVSWAKFSRCWLLYDDRGIEVFPTCYYDLPEDVT